jgi:hypothetical protein
MPDGSIVIPDIHAAPKDYSLAGAQEIQLKSVRAVIDGSGAASAFLPTLQLLDPNQNVMWEGPAPSTVAAGGSADVSWFPGLTTSSAAPFYGFGFGPRLFGSVTNPTNYDSIGTLAISSDNAIAFGFFYVFALNTFTAGAGNYSLNWSDLPTGFTEDNPLLLQGYTYKGFDDGASSAFPIAGHDSGLADGNVNLFTYNPATAALNTYTAATWGSIHPLVIASGTIMGAPRTVV